MTTSNNNHNDQDRITQLESQISKLNQEKIIFMKEAYERETEYIKLKSENKRLESKVKHLSIYEKNIELDDKGETKDIRSSLLSVISYKDMKNFKKEETFLGNSDLLNLIDMYNSQLESSKVMIGIEKEKNIKLKLEFDEESTKKLKFERENNDLSRRIDLIEEELRKINEDKSKLEIDLNEACLENENLKQKLCEVSNDLLESRKMEKNYKIEMEKQLATNKFLVVEMDNIRSAKKNKQK